MHAGTHLLEHHGREARIGRGNALLLVELPAGVEEPLGVGRLGHHANTGVLRGAEDDRGHHPSDSAREGELEERVHGEEGEDVLEHFIDPKLYRSLECVAYECGSESLE